MSLRPEQPTTDDTEALEELAAFPLLEALYGRRRLSPTTPASRQLGATVPPDDSSWTV